MPYYDTPYDFDVGQAPLALLPRPLFPPGHPEAPEGGLPMRGPDVWAYKRILWHLGRWATSAGVPSADPKFDEAYSKAFAHGVVTDRGTINVGSSGIEGFQRQARIAGANGVIGQRTFDALIYCRIPEGLPHAGKFPLAIDALALERLHEAGQRFREEDGGEPAPPSLPSPRQRALDWHEAHVGLTEQPAGSNTDSRPDGIRAAQIRCANGATWLVGQPWCGVWVFAGLEAAGVAGIDSSLASVALIEDNARAGRKCFVAWTRDRSRVRPGDAIVIGGRGVHVETVRGRPRADGSVPTYGGNTSPGVTGSQSNGGGAFRRLRYPNEIYGFALVRYPGE